VEACESATNRGRLNPSPQPSPYGRGSLGRPLAERRSATAGSPGADSRGDSAEGRFGAKKGPENNSKTRIFSRSVGFQILFSGAESRGKARRTRKKRRIEPDGFKTLDSYTLLWHNSVIVEKCAKRTRLRFSGAVFGSRGGAEARRKEEGEKKSGAVIPAQAGIPLLLRAFAFSFASFAWEFGRWFHAKSAKSAKARRTRGGFSSPRLRVSARKKLVRAEARRRGEAACPAGRLRRAGSALNSG